MEQVAQLDPGDVDALPGLLGVLEGESTWERFLSLRRWLRPLLLLLLLPFRDDDAAEVNPREPKKPRPPLRFDAESEV